MSLALFDTVPAGAIETLFDEQNQPLFKRARLGKYLGIGNIKDTYQDIETISRKSVLNGGAFAAPLKAGTNWHDDALGIATRSRKPKAADLIKWLAKKGVEKIQEEHRQAITGIQREHSLPLKNMRKQLHCTVMIYKTVTTRSKLSSMRT